jgi:predicted MFS family arabinose efflux permease
MLPFHLASDDDLGPEPERPAPSPVELLMVLGFINMLGFAGWQALINNFAREQAGFGWFETGLNQSFREIPGLLAFTAVYWLMWMREQTLAFAGLALIAFGVAITGFFPTLTGILLTTLVMSFGFHYFETASHALQLQLLRDHNAARDMGRIYSASAFAQFVAYAGIFMLTAWVGVKAYTSLFLLIGIAGLGLTYLSWRRFPQYEGTVVQRKEIVVRRRYGLYYAITFMSGARRQIFSAFGAFLLVDRFGLTIDKVALLYLATALATTVLAPHLGQMIARIGERRTMLIENLILVTVFSGYALTTSASVAVVLFIIDGVSMSLMIAQRTYFQKIGDEADMAATASVAFTVNHIAAVVIPVVFGLIGHREPSIIFWLGALIAGISLILALLVPRDPAPGNESLDARFWRQPKPGPKLLTHQPAE